MQTREALEREIAQMQSQVSSLNDSHEWADQCEQALLATAIMLHQDLLADSAARPAATDR